ncbi:hypothetical protein [Kitasatospora sp. NPDC001547]|uniref:hypothetical protein n=1 Tax=Kitasatospora sp. NPDC001547 TaxID=3364015 RepID=UPI0036B83E44
MTTVTRQDAGLWTRCRDAARHQGLAPALRLLGSSLTPGLLPCGPGGHTVADAGTFAAADWLWVDGTTRPRRPGDEAVLSRTPLPGGEVVAAAVTTAPQPAGRSAAERDAGSAFVLGLAWVRLGLSESLRSACLDYLGRRRSGDTYLLQQQLVKGTVAEAVADHLEVEAVLSGAGPGDLSAAVLADLHARITAADREQVRLLGASGYLRDGPGMPCYLSELVAEVFVTGEEPR